MFKSNIFPLAGQLLEFSLNQENCRNQWLTSERELERMRQQISEAEHLKAKLEAQNHHAHGLLQSEIRKRIKEQQEKKEVVIMKTSVLFFLLLFIKILFS